MVALFAKRLNLFQPTLPARGATSEVVNTPVPDEFQPTLPARGATPLLGLPLARLHNFNPRSPHGERPYEDSLKYDVVLFQPTLPARGATF